jgi:hypothetical protein
MERALNTLKEAVQVLSAGTGHSRECLKMAAEDICRLRPEQFPNGLRNRFLRLLDEIGCEHRLAWKADSEKAESLRNKIDKLDHADCIRLIYEVIKLENELEMHMSGPN